MFSLQHSLSSFIFSFVFLFFLSFSSYPYFFPSLLLLRLTSFNLFFPFPLLLLLFLLPFLTNSSSPLSLPFLSITFFFHFFLSLFFIFFLQSFTSPFLSYSYLFFTSSVTYPLHSSLYFFFSFLFAFHTSYSFSFFFSFFLSYFSSRLSSFPFFLHSCLGALLGRLLCVFAWLWIASGIFWTHVGRELSLDTSGASWVSCTYRCLFFFFTRSPTVSSTPAPE